ncbi:glucose-1-phosphate cytidylyltransferase [Gammaproteobacteria bacterium]|nr:glucose-1-phosphate cytidylyltransferase [Gammaproteobacteria bacterium]MDC3279290.1 glucose-1-phosphate cytidylyltransferase [Gammaproteobacteria bacterium]
MKVVILAGGLGTRLSEHTSLIPKPMVEIGGKPILWHIMHLYASHGFNEFIVALGYRGEVVKHYFANYKNIHSDFTVDLRKGDISFTGDGHDNDWAVTLIDTGQNVMTGGRVKRLEQYLRDAPFMLTYGDGVSDVDINALLQQHQKSDALGTISAVHPKAHYGELDLDGNQVIQFMEKPEFRRSWINGGFMVLEPEILDLIPGDDSIFEKDVLEVLSRQGLLEAYQHAGFWQCMDTLRDVKILNELWNSGNRPWIRR